MDSKPILVPQKFEVGRRPKAPSAPPLNGAPTQNGVVGKRKRDADEANLEDQHEVKKRNKVQPATTHDDLIVLDDSGNGAIVID